MTIENELADSVEEFYPLNQSLLLEVYNSRMWEWLLQWGLIRALPDTQYLTFDKMTPTFDATVTERAFKSGVLGRVRASVIFPFRAAKAVAAYDPKSIDLLYDAEMRAGYAKLKRTALLAKFNSLWELLLENIKYALLSGLIVQYRLHIEIPKAYHKDLLAAKNNALHALQQKELSRKSFDDQFGFLASAVYDLSVPRYHELRSFPATGLLVAHDGPAAFREHVRFRSAKLIALMRKLLLVIDGEQYFYKFKEEIATPVDVKKRMRELAAVHSAVVSDKLSGLCVSGKGVVTGPALIILNAKDYAHVRKGDIIVTKNLSPDIIALFPLVGGIVSEKGGQLSHLAIVAREQNIAVLAQVSGAVKVLHSGQNITLDLASGRITR